MNYDTLVKSHIYGFELYYRIEYRAAPTGRPPPESENTDTMWSDVHLDNYILGGDERNIRPTLIISYRKEIGGVLKILYEAPPISGKEIVKWLAGSKNESPELNDLPTETKRKFVTDFIGRELEIGDANKKLNKDHTAMLKKQREERQQRRKDVEELTLGIMLLADEKLLDLSDDDKRIIPKLIERAGSLLWREAIPKEFLWLVNSSEHERKQVKRIMKEFFYEQTNAGVCETNPWLDYDASPNRKKHIDSKAYTQKYVEVASLSEEQCILIIKKCKQRLEAKSANGIDIAVLLMLTLSMDEDEICAINLEDFSYLMSYNHILTIAAY